MTLRLDFIVNYDTRGQVSFSKHVGIGNLTPNDEFHVSFTGRHHSKQLMLDDDFMNLELVISFKKKTLFVLNIKQNDMMNAIVKKKEQNFVLEEDITRITMCIGLPYAYLAECTRDRALNTPYRIESELDFEYKILFDLSHSIERRRFTLEEFVVVFPKRSILY